MYENLNKIEENIEDLEELDHKALQMNLIAK